MTAALYMPTASIGRIPKFLPKLLIIQFKNCIFKPYEIVFQIIPNRVKCSAWFTIMNLFCFL